MKRINSIIFMISIIFIVLSCQNGTKKTAITEKEKPKQNQDSILRNNLWKSDNNRIYLLSYKYELSDTIVREIILKYLDNYSPVYYYLLNSGKMDTINLEHIFDKYENPPNMKSLIDTISIDYGVSKKKISQIIFDYKLLQSFDDIKEQN